MYVAKLLIHWIWTEDQQIAFILLYALQNQVVQVNHGRKEYSTISLKPGRASSSDGEIQLHVSFVLHCIMLFKIIPHCVHVQTHVYVWCICTCVCTGMLTGARGECQASCSVIHLIPLRQGLSLNLEICVCFLCCLGPPASPSNTPISTHTPSQSQGHKCWCPHPASYEGAGDLNSGPWTCKQALWPSGGAASSASHACSILTCFVFSLQFLPQVSLLSLKGFLLIFFVMESRNRCL